MRWLWTNIEHQIETLAAVNVDIEQARETLAHLEETTSRVRLLAIDGDRFVVLPATTLTNPPWTVGGRPALKLSSESRNSMTALERQLTRAFRELSAQFARERTQHAAQIATLRRQVEQLAGQVTRLTTDYRALTAMLRGRWN